MRALAAIEHRGGYRVAASAPTRAPQRVELPDASPGLEHLRRETESSRVLWSIVSIGVGTLAAALICAASDQAAWTLLVGPLLGLPVLAWWTRRLVHVRALDADALRRVHGELVRSPMGGWRFVANDGTRYALLLPGAAHSFARRGPALATVDTRSHAALAWSSLPLDDDRDLALCQAELDRFFGTNPSDRAFLAQGRLSPRMRALAAIQALLVLVPCLGLVVGIVVAAWRVPFCIVFLTLPALFALLVAPTAQRAWEGTCLVVEGCAHPHTWSVGRDYVHGLVLGGLVLRLRGQTAASVVQCGAHVRAYYDPHGLFDLPSNRLVLAVEQLTPPPPPSPKPDHTPAWLAADAHFAIEEFRRSLH